VRGLRLALLASGVVALSLGRAGAVANVPRVGYVGNSSAALEANLVGALREGLQSLGYVEGLNIAVEYRWADGREERFPELVADLLRARVDVIVAAGTPAILAAKQATKTTPIVMAVVSNAVETGLVASLAKPGGNVTGLTTMVPDVEGKRMELLKATVPGLSRIAVLVNEMNPSIPPVLAETQKSARKLGLTTAALNGATVAELDSALAELATHRPSAVIVLADRSFLARRKRIVDVLTRERLPAICAYEEFVQEGALMSYGPNYPDSFRRAAAYVDKILKGANPADLPVEQPTKFELVVNRRTAKALGLELPPELLVLADRVIE